MQSRGAPLCNGVAGRCGWLEVGPRHLPTPCDQERADASWGARVQSRYKYEQASVRLVGGVDLEMARRRARRCRTFAISGRCGWRLLEDHFGASSLWSELVVFHRRPCRGTVVDVEHMLPAAPGEQRGAHRRQQACRTDSVAGAAAEETCVRCPSATGTQMFPERAKRAALLTLRLPLA